MRVCARETHSRGVLIANECVGIIHPKEKNLGVKLDLQKAYEQVSWDFLGFALARKTFGPKWRG